MVDTRTEREIQAAMEALMEGKTCFVIAHRLSTIRHADHILVMREGGWWSRGPTRPSWRRTGFMPNCTTPSLQDEGEIRG